MTYRSYETLADAVAAQISLLREGKPLEAFDAFFGETVLMYANDALFASGAVEGRSRQEPFIAAAKTIAGHITDVNVLEEESVCVFRNRTKFTDSNGLEHQIDGLSWQRWKDGFIIEERYYDGDLMGQLISEGVLGNPAILISRSKVRPALIPKVVMSDS